MDRIAQAKRVLSSNRVFLITPASGNLAEVLSHKIALDPSRFARPLMAGMDFDPQEVVFKHGFTPEKEAMTGERRLAMLHKSGDLCLGLEHAVDYCLNPEKYPKGWKTTETGNPRCVLFDGTVLEAPEQFYSVIYLYWENGKLKCGERWIDDGFEYTDEDPNWVFETATFAPH